jgi:predicted RecB family nuclease
MKINSDLFYAYLKCPLKCKLRATNELVDGNDYPEWVKAQNYSYRVTETARLVSASPKNKIALSPNMENVKRAQWRLATSLAINAQMDSFVLETELHAIERVPANGRGQSTQLIPIRFVFTNKLDRDDKLLLAFDVFTLSKSLGREISLGKIIHGDDHATLRVKTSALAGEIRKRIEKIVALLASPSPPDLILNRHCVECEFQTRCHKEASQQDDLSLLSGMTWKERKKYNSRGTFTVKQLSFAFLPRRRPKKARDKRERYYHSLKALAIRQEKIHVAGRPELKIEGTPVFLDVEGIPDRDFYYLIGLRIRNGNSVVQHSLWADALEDEARIYSQFIEILKATNEPKLIYYGSFETDFLTQMEKRCGVSIRSVLESNGNHTPTNLLSIIYGQVYFPTHANNLKSIARFLGFEWSNASLTGIKSIAYRCDWEKSHNSQIKTALINYNAEDCQATEVVAQALLRLLSTDPWVGNGHKSESAVSVESLKNPRHAKVWGVFESQFKEFEQINQSAWWNYQRDRIFVRSNKRPKPKSPQLRRPHLGPRSNIPLNRTIIYPKLTSCPSCGRVLTQRKVRDRMLYDLFFGKSYVKRWVSRCRFHYYWCSHCCRRFGEPKEFWPQSHLGRNLVAYVLYHIVELHIPFQTVREILVRCFKMDLVLRTLFNVKRMAAKLYESTYEAILRHLVSGNLLHVDETQVSVRGRHSLHLGLYEFARRRLCV